MKKISFRFIAMVIIIFAAVSTAMCTTHKDLVRTRPNIIFIVLDAARADHFSCYGYEKNTTPRIDGIAKKGVVFLNHFSQATGTTHSVPSYLSSRYFSKPFFYPYRYIFNMLEASPESLGKELDKEQIILPKELSANGYKTAIFHNHAWFGKNSLLIKSFDEAFAYPLSSSRPNNQNIITSLLRWIRANSKTPFFAYCHIMSPHMPYPPKPEDLLFLSGGDSSDLKRIRQKINSASNNSDAGWTTQELLLLKTLYNSNLNHSDKWIGILYDKLVRMGLDKNTLFIIGADHGENLGDHHSRSHGGPPWETLTHVPCIMVYPPRVPAETRIVGLTENIDIAPTIIDIASIGLPQGKTMDGISLLDIIDSPEKAKSAVYTQASVRTSRFKYFQKNNALYDIKNDVGETINIASQKPAIVTQMKKLFERIIIPRKEHYDKAFSTHVPDEPFCFDIKWFGFHPKDIYNISHEKYDDINVLKTAAADKSWLFNRHYHGSGLFCFPGISAIPEITLTAAMPKHKYRVFLLLESEKEIDDNLGFRYKTTDFLKMKKAYAITRLPVTGPTYSAYLDLGVIDVSSGTLSLTIDFDSTSDVDYYVIRHIKFIPEGIAAGNNLSEQETARRRQQLKALGYM